MPTINYPLAAALPRPLRVFGTWKNVLTPERSVHLVREIRSHLEERPVPFEVSLCPSMLALQAVAAEAYAAITLTSQNMIWNDVISFTGETSAAALLEIGCKYVMLGHSERRIHLGETDTQIAKKLRSAVQSKLIPLVCVGESHSEYLADRAREVIQSQLEPLLASISEIDDPRSLLIAYEPSWSITTGHEAIPPDPDRAQVIHRWIRNFIAHHKNASFAEEVAIIYGAGVNPDNVANFLRQPDIDGVLVGGASQDSSRFIQLLEAVRHEVRRQTAGQVFIEHLREALDRVSDLLTRLAEHSVEAVHPGTVCTIDRNTLIAAIPSHLRDLVAVGIPDYVAAVTFFPMQSIDNIHANWLATQLEKTERQHNCIVYISVNGSYVRPRQFLQIKTPLRLIATGARPKEALTEFTAMALTFDRSWFDADGYLIQDSAR